MTDDERDVIAILVNSPRSPDQWLEPIHKVDAVMHWDSETTRKFVEGLKNRKLIVERTEARDHDAPGHQLWWWERAEG